MAKASRTKSDPKRDLLRHAVATLAYRGGKTLRRAPKNLATIRACDTSRSAVEILAHINHLLAWACSSVAEKEAWRKTKINSWKTEVDQFFKLLKQLDRALAEANPLPIDAERLFQGPIADAFTHVGQLATLRRLAGSPIKGENYFVAKIVVGRVGPKQSSPKYEFD